MVGWSLEAVRHALATARERGYAEVEVHAEGAQFQAKLSAVLASRAARTVAEAEGSADPSLGVIAATLVGYYQPGPTPLQTGQQVVKGEVIAVITALGLANDVESPLSGEVVQVLVEPGQSVEFGQPLAQVRSPQ